MKNFADRIGRILLLFGLLAPVMLSAAVKKIPAEKWVISTGGDRSRTTLFSAGELQKLLALRIGKKIPVITTGKVPSGAVILLDKCDRKLGNESFRIRRDKDVIRITGGCPIGTLYGVYEFLQRYCDVWSVAPGVTYAPEGKALVFGKMDLTLRPVILKRELYHTGSDYTVRAKRVLWNDFNTRNRISFYPYSRNAFAPYVSREFQVSRATGKQSCHSFYDYVPVAKYAKTHPEYYSMNRAGVRDSRPNRGGQLCLSNPDVEKIVYEHLITSIAADRKKFPVNYPRVYDFSQLDNAAYLCYCAPCQKIIARYGKKDAGLMIWFVNKIGRKVKKLYPDVKIRTFAYVNTEHLPVGIRAEDNVIVQLCDLYSQSNHTLPLTHPINKKRSALTRGWGKLAKNLMIWDYILQSGNEPVVPVDAIAADVRLYRDCNVKWIFMESEIRAGNPSAFEYLKNFLVAQLYFNPDQDLEKLLDVYCRGVFGSVHKEMRTYLEMLRNAQKKYPTERMDAWHRRDLTHLTIPFLRKCKALVEKARRINKDPKVDMHILREKNCLDNALSSRLNAYPKLAAERKAILKDLLENRLKVLKDHGFIPSRYKHIEREIRIPIEESMIVFTDIPEELKKLPPGTIRFLGASRQHRGGYNSRFVKDPDSKLRRVLSWQHADTAKFPKVIGCGVYDQQLRRARSTRITAPADEKYHWYKIVRFKMGPSTIFYAMPDWHIGFNLRGFFVVSDGVKEQDDPNLYDLWVSIKFQGPAYKKGSTKTNAVLFERAMLVPVSKKLGNMGSISTGRVRQF